MLQALNSGYYDYDFITMDAGVYQLLIMRFIGEYEIEYCVRCNDLLNTLAVF